MNAKQLLKDAEQRMMTEYHKDLAHASAQELHSAISGAAMDALQLFESEGELEFDIGGGVGIVRQLLMVVVPVVLCRDP